MKTILKKLASEIDSVLNQNEYANEMAALIDHGEWSETAPDFTKLVKSWGLTREKLNAMLDEASEYAKKWEKKVGNYRFNAAYGPTDINPWHHVMESFHCVFMTDIL